MSREHGGTPLERRKDDDVPAGGRAGADGEIAPRAAIRRTLERARELIRASRLRAATSRALLAGAESLVDESDRAVQESLALRAQLRASVTGYVRFLKADGAPPERVLVLVKSVVREATPPELDVVEARALMAEVVRWSVDAYYHAA